MKFNIVTIGEIPTEWNFAYGMKNKFVYEDIELSIFPYHENLYKEEIENFKEADSFLIFGTYGKENVLDDIKNFNSLLQILRNKIDFNDYKYSFFYIFDKIIPNWISIFFHNSNRKYLCLLYENFLEKYAVMLKNLNV